MIRRRYVHRLSMLFCAVLSWSTYGAALDDAQQNYTEAQQILKDASGRPTDPKSYAEAIRKLQKAQSFLDQAGNSDSRADSLGQSIAAALFWARRFSNVNVIEELKKPGSSGNGSPKSPPSATNAGAGDAEAAFKKAEEFEKTHSGDDYAVAQRWFQFADEHSGTDLGSRAHARALDAQARHQAAIDAKNAASQTEDAKLIAAGNILLQQKDLDAALAKYELAKKVADTTLVERRLGHVYTALGYKMRDEYAAQYLPLLKSYNEAVARGDKQRATQLRVEAQVLVSRLRPVEEKALKNYDLAQDAYQHGLDLAKGKDLDCEAHLGILNFDRGKASHAKARSILSSVITKYTPGNDEERTTFEFARTLLKSMGGAI